MIGDGIPPLIGQAAITLSQDIYVMGGFNTVSHGAIIKITLPRDICTMYTTHDACQLVPGCKSCDVMDISTGIIYPYCFSVSNDTPTKYVSFYVKTF